MFNLDRQNMLGFIRFSTVMSKDIITSPHLSGSLPLVTKVSRIFISKRTVHNRTRFHSCKINAILY